MVFSSLPSTIVRELGVKWPEAPVQEAIDLLNATCLLNQSAIYSTLGQTERGTEGWERIMSRTQPHSESEDFRWEVKAG